MKKKHKRNDACPEGMAAERPSGRFGLEALCISCSQRKSIWIYKGRIIISIIIITIIITIISIIIIIIIPIANSVNSRRSWPAETPLNMLVLFQNCFFHISTADDKMFSLNHHKNVSDIIRTIRTSLSGGLVWDERMHDQTRLKKKTQQADWHVTTSITDSPSQTNFIFMSCKRDQLTKLENLRKYLMQSPADWVWDVRNQAATPLVTANCQNRQLKKRKTN